MKIVRYEDFVKIPDALSFEDAGQIYKSILSAKQDADIEFLKLLKELLSNAVNYADIRSRWLLMSAQQTAQMDATRSQYHDLFIYAANNVANYLEKCGYRIAWREQLGNDRKRLGDFACYLAYIQGINAR